MDACDEGPIRELQISCRTASRHIKPECVTGGGTLIQDGGPEENCSIANIIVAVLSQMNPRKAMHTDLA